MSEVEAMLVELHDNRCDSSGTLIQPPHSWTRSLAHLHAAVSDDLGHDAVEGQLLVEGLDALVSRVVELPGAIKVQNVPEHLGVSVEEVFLRVLVVEKLLFWGAQQRVGVPVQSVLPCLEKWKKKKCVRRIISSLTNYIKFCSSAGFRWRVHTLISKWIFSGASELLGVVITC